MTEAEAIEAILQRWLDAWPTLQPGVPYVFNNESFDSVDNWARVTVIHTTRPQRTAGPEGNRKFDARGFIQVQLFGSIDVGDKNLAALAGSVRAVFEARRIGEITTHGAPSRPSTDGRWAMLLVSTPFRYDETR